jgi:hypothetical protein
MSRDTRRLFVPRCPEVIMSPLLRRPLLSVAALLVFLSAGCVEFEKQTAYFVFPKDRDEVHALFIYEGIRVDAANVAALNEATAST